MVSFYLGPPLAMIVLATSLRNGWRRLWSAWTIAMIATVVAWQRLSEWGYWIPMVLLLVAGLIVAWPGRDAMAPSDSERSRWSMDNLPDPLAVGRVPSSADPGLPDHALGTSLIP